MNEGKRPGGLTALAVLNFIFSGWGLLGIIGMIVMLALFGMLAENMDEQSRTQWEAMQTTGRPMLICLLVASAISSILLLISGIGYIKQKKFLGRTLGNAYAILAIIIGVVSAVMMKREIGGGFTIGAIIGLIYPVLTLILLNTTFKEDLTN
ncbi:MAG TPA: hypothetical protein ENH84_03875 [Phycisphaerae bacterium]|nr:hypothetical protein [Phycisphaerae bacterium]